MSAKSRVRAFNDSMQPGVYIKLSNGTTGFMFDNINTGIMLSAMQLEKYDWMAKKEAFADVFVVETGNTKTICASDVKATCRVGGVEEDSETPRIPLSESLKMLPWRKWNE